MLLIATPIRSAIIQEIQRMHTAGLATMAYYYFDFRDVKKQDCYGLFSSSFFNFLPTRMLVTTSSPSYTQTIFAAHESQILMRLKNA